MNSKSFSKIMYTYIFIVLIMVMSLIVYSDLHVTIDQSIVVITFIINGILIIRNLLKSSRLGYSLKDVVNLFMFLFMFLSPMIQYVTNKFPWWDIHLITDEAIIQANVTILIFLVTYQLSYSLKSKHTNKTAKNNFINRIDVVFNILFLFSIISSSFIILNVGFYNLFSRATYIIDINSSSLSLIVSNSMRAIPVIYVAINLVYLKKNRSVFRKLPFFIGVFLMLLVNFPTSTARFWMASVYLGLFIIIIGRSKNPHFLKFILLFGMTIIFPVINIFRRNTWQEAIILGIDIPRITELFTYGDFDSYSMLTRALLYTDTNGITWGKQLLGNLLFFVPRSIWPSKPIGSGVMIASDLGWKFTNVSCPFVGEGYINFGLVGVILFAIVLGKLSKVADYKYSYSIENNIKNINFVDLYYPFTLGFIFFIMRGDLLSSLSFYLGFMFPIIFLYLFQKIFSIK